MTDHTTDRLGTPQRVTDSTKAVVWTATYAPFGRGAASAARKRSILAWSFLPQLTAGKSLLEIKKGGDSWRGMGSAVRIFSSPWVERQSHDLATERRIGLNRTPKPIMKGSGDRIMKSLSDPSVRQELLQRLAELSPQDKGRWGRMSVRQVVCHLNDSYRVALGEKPAAPATGFMEKTLLKRLALYAPFQWPKGVPTVPEVEQGKGGTAPGDFCQDLSTLVSTFSRFCAGLPDPCVPHPMFGPMKEGEWMRWGYLHADHHLRQFGR